jgi:hypothetical protein
VSKESRKMNGAEGASMLSQKPSGSVPVCETPEYYAIHGCPHGRGEARSEIKEAA